LMPSTMKKSWRPRVAMSATIGFASWLIGVD
jgi:hypothetical protein